MEYTIKEVSEMTGIPATTLRYYDNEGLLPGLKRKQSGTRVFTENDLATLQLVNCLKSTGMSIKDMKRFFILVQEGDSSLEERYQMFLRQKEYVENQMKNLQNMLDVVEYKCQYYKKAVSFGSESLIQNKEKLPHYDEFLSHVSSHKK